MSDDNPLSRPEIGDRIAILRDNIRQLIEQAAGHSGGQAEKRNSDRIAQRCDELDRLIKERDAPSKKWPTMAILLRRLDQAPVQSCCLLAEGQ